MNLKASEEQVLYANILNIGMFIGLISLTLSIILYISGILEPLIPIEKIEEYWVKSVNDYLRLSGMQTGWAWLEKLKYGDMLNLLPIAFLSLISVICYIAILPALIRKKDTAFIVIAILEILVLTFAASGIVGTGGH